MAAATTATATINTFLMKFDGVTAEPTSADISKATKLLDIKSHPAMGGEPEQLETTTLSDDIETFINGVQSADTKEFTANYIPSAYQKLKALEGDESLWWGLFLGADSKGNPDGHDGIFVWQGGITTAFNEGEVNAVREMTCYISSGTKPKFISAE